MPPKTVNSFPLSLESLAPVGQWLREGNVAALPTETVYGLAGNGYDERAVARIFSLKNRPQFNPLILHYAHIKEIEQDALFNPTALHLAQAFWPGPLTLVLPRSPQCRVPLLASAGLPTLAVRIPRASFLEALIAQERFPLAAPSANRSGHISSTTPAHVLRSLGSQENLLLVDGGACPIGIESTILDLTTATPVLLRTGALPFEKIEEFLGQPLRMEQSGNQPKAPGQLTSHYAPRQPVRLNATSVSPHEGLLAFGPSVCEGAALTLNLSETGDMIQAAARLFSYLHLLEESEIPQIAVMPIPLVGLGIAINDRLFRASIK